MTQDETDHKKQPDADLPRPLPRPLRLAIALSIAIASGAFFDWLTLPLPWMLGPMIATAVAAVARAPIAAPTKLRPYIVVVIGVMLGSGFSPALIDQIGLWAISFVGLILYLAIASAIVVPYYRRIGRFDVPTAYFAGMPGGLNEMMIVGKAMGGDERAIVLAQASRIIIVVVILAIWFRVVQGIDLSDQSAYGVPFTEIPPIELLVLLLTGIVGFFLGNRLRLPAPSLLGPMIASAIVHFMGLTTNPPPREMVIVAQILLGTIIGGRFIGATPRSILRALVLSAGATALMLTITFGFAAIMYSFVGQSLEQVLLAYAPGGLAEMSLVALAMKADIAYVSSHHLLRISLVIAVAPVLFRLIERRFRGR